MKKIKLENDTENLNPFKKMSFFKFWIISTCFYLFFPVSLIMTFIIFGKLKTKQLLVALANDFFQTIFIFLIFIGLIIWFIYYYLSNLFL